MHTYLGHVVEAVAARGTVASPVAVVVVEPSRATRVIANLVLPSECRGASDNRSDDGPTNQEESGGEACCMAVVVDRRHVSGSTAVKS